MNSVKSGTRVALLGLCFVAFFAAFLRYPCAPAGGQRRNSGVAVVTRTYLSFNFISMGTNLVDFNVALNRQNTRFTAGVNRGMVVMGDTRTETHDCASVNFATHPTKMPLNFVSDQNVALALYKHARWDITGTINATTQTGFASRLSPPQNDRVNAHLSQQQEAIDAIYDKSLVSVGRVSGKVLVFCEFWRPSYAVFVYDCLPRLLVAWARLPDQQRNTTRVAVPGKGFAMQYLVEVLGFKHEQLLVLPSQQFDLAVMDGKNKHIPFIEIDEIIYAAPLEGNAIDILSFSVPILRSVIIPYIQCLPSFFQLMSEQQRAKANGNINNKYHHTWMTRRTSLSDTLKAIERTKEYPTVVFSESIDMSMPDNFREFWPATQARLSDVAQLFSVRMETQRVVTQLALAHHAQVMVGPSGHSLTNAAFMREGASIVEFVDEENDDDEQFSPANSHYTPRITTQVAGLIGTRRIEVLSVYGSSTGQKSTRRQPQYNPDNCAEAILTSLDSKEIKEKRNEKEAMTMAWLSAPLIGCSLLIDIHNNTSSGSQNAFELQNKMRIKTMGAHPRMEAQTLREIEILRNLTEHDVAPPLGFCVDKGQLLYAQALTDSVGSQFTTKEAFYSSIAGFLKHWNIDVARGDHHLFHCNQNDWAMSRTAQAIPQIPSVENSLVVQEGVLCVTDADCLCGANSASPWAGVCQSGSCTRQGLHAASMHQAHDWFASAARRVPHTLVDGPSFSVVAKMQTSKSYSCASILKFLQSKMPHVLSMLPTPACPEAMMY